MFGYVVINKQELKFKEYDEYRGFYCGLCHSLKERYGYSGQITLNYDLTFLSILLTALYEEEVKSSKSRCVIHPLNKQLKYANNYIDYCVDMTILLSYYKCQDDIADEKKIVSYLEANLLRKKISILEEIYPQKCQKIREYLAASAKLEKENTTDIDKISNQSGYLLSEIFAYKDDEWSASLKEMGFYLGKFIYLIDAYEDVEKDIKINSFNLFKDKYQDINFDTYIQDLLGLMISSCANAFETLPIFEYRDILRNILYSGIWTKYEIIKERKGK